MMHKIKVLTIAGATTGLLLFGAVQANAEGDPQPRPPESTGSAPEPLVPPDVKADSPSQDIPGKDDAKAGSGEGYDYTTMTLTVDGAPREFRVPLERTIKVSDTGAAREEVRLDLRGNPELRELIETSEKASADAGQ